MKCKNCGNELLDEDKFCGKCGTIIDEKVIIDDNKTKNEHSKKSIKIKFNLLVVIIMVVILIVGLIAVVIYYNTTVINDKYLTNNFKEEGFSEFDNVEVKVLDIEDINYKNFNKLVLAKLTVNNNNNNNNEVSNVGFLLVNRKEDNVEGFTITNNLILLLNGIAENDIDKAKDVTKLSAAYIQEVGTDIFQNKDTDDFKNLMNEYSKIIGLENSREYIKTEFAKQTNYTTLDYTLLFEKQSPMVKYIAFYETNTKYNSKYPIDENTYNYFSKQYKYKNTLDTFEYLYGSAYTTVKEYNVYPTFTEFADEEEFEKSKVGSYSSLEKAKESLDVEE